ncbi:hypothetical protein CHS0354_023096 [Potamilus streckersoni]|uniref:Uncharacterized protein n=1 Tax=Potamilus streckersoni TaxID=2493646 RepID=A0AAE0W6F0_9BIVA|nr:hypothetical protein CHS0354_023096 [Potamilus streckersoni]
MSTGGVQELSIIKVIWFIAAGVLIFFLIFLFVKRQIMRFTFKPSYTAIGHNAPKKLQMEIQRRLERVSYIKGEPKLLTGKIEEIARTTENHYYYRMKAVDAFSQFDEVLKSENVNTRGRHPSQTVRNYLLTLYPQYLQTAPADLIHHFADAYEHARHGPKVFGKQQYNKYMEMLEELILNLKVGLQENKQCEDSVQFNAISLLDTEVTFNPYSKSSKTKTSIPYNHMVSSERMQTGFRNQSKYRTRASSTEQEGLLESNQSSQRSSIAELDASMEGSGDQKLLTLGDEEKS